MAFSETELSFADAIEKVSAQIFLTISSRLNNFVFQLIHRWTGKSVAFTSYEKHVDINARRLRACALDYVRKRRDG